MALDESGLRASPATQPQRDKAKKQGRKKRIVINESVIDEEPKTTISSRVPQNTGAGSSA
ncbi:MAG: hypothetical protein H7Z74_02705 [Anaerolineae bacterium]|nr:hypothetical protein [Gemmatimonadaceae bacterium]